MKNYLKKLWILPFYRRGRTNPAEKEICKHGLISKFLSG
jgi:hypothetical protein